jgi:hypothetical protein
MLDVLVQSHAGMYPAEALSKATAHGKRRIAVPLIEEGETEIKYRMEHKRRPELTQQLISLVPDSTRLVSL